MPFRQVSKPIDSSVAPNPKHVARWLWQVDKSTSPIVKKHGQQMIDTYFESIEAAELFVLHGE